MKVINMDKSAREKTGLNCIEGYLESKDVNRSDSPRLRLYAFNIWDPNPSPMDPIQTNLIVL